MGYLVEFFFYIVGLCLVQLCDPQGQVTAIRIEKRQQEAPNLKQLMEATSIVKIFHFARFDVAMLQHHLDIKVSPIFCTKIASKLARTYTGKHGLKDLVIDFSGGMILPPQFSKVLNLCGLETYTKGL